RRGRVQRAPRDRQAAAEQVFLGPVVGARIRGEAAEAERSGAAPGNRVVRTAAVLGAVGVEGQREAVVEVPLHVQADRVVLELLLVALLLEAEVLSAAGQVADVGRGRDQRIAIEGYVGQAVLQPQGLLATILGDLVGRVGVVQGEGHRVARSELQHRLRADALALEVRVRVTHVVRHGVQLADRRGVLDHRVRAEAAVRAGPAGHGPGILRGLGRAAVTLLVAGIHAHAPGLVRVGVAEDAGDFRGDVAAKDLRLVGHRLDSGAGDDFATRVVERTRGQDVDRGADAAAGVGSAAGLVHG